MTDIGGRQVADLLAFNYKDPREWLSTGATIDSNDTLFLHPGDYLVLEGQMVLIIAVTACAVEESPCNAYRCTPVKVEIII
ncbi:MAG: DUF1989 domain-containing protein [Bacillota bacterium]